MPTLKLFLRPATAVVLAQRGISICGTLAVPHTQYTGYARGAVSPNLKVRLTSRFQMQFPLTVDISCDTIGIVSTKTV